ncbi:MAG: hypothetical protein WAN94_10520, partial [Pseudolabrys sp.]
EYVNFRLVWSRYCHTRPFKLAVVVLRATFLRGRRKKAILGYNIRWFASESAATSSLEHRP